MNIHLVSYLILLYIHCSGNQSILQGFVLRRIKTYTIFGWGWVFFSENLSIDLMNYLFADSQIYTNTVLQ